MAALRLVLPYGTIPVPFVLDAVGEYFIILGLRGEPLGTICNACVNRFRNSYANFAPFPNDAPGVLSGPHCYVLCCDVNRVEEFQFGPFASLAAFHLYLLSRIPPQYGEEITKVIEGVHAKPHTVYFMHGDLNLRNILVEDGRVTGIVDWTCAGWYPG